MLKSKSVKNASLLFFSLCALFLLSRIVFLDSDLPQWDIFNYQPVDEPWYNNTAFNLFHYSDIKHQVLPYVKSDSISQNLFENVIAYGFLRGFGNNYYGLRLPSVFASFIVFVLFFFLLKNYLVRQDLEGHDVPPGYFNPVVFGCLVYLLFDFSFLLSGRASEPTIFRMLSLVSLLYIFSIAAVEKYIYAKWFPFAAGFAAVAAVFYVYPSNAFIVPALWLVCFYAGLRESLKTALAQTGLFLLGAGLCLVSYDITLRLFFDKSYLEQLLFYSAFLDVVDLPVGSGSANALIIVKRHLANIFGIFSTNVFRLNPVLLAAFLASLPVFVFKLVKEKTFKDIFLAGLLAFLFLQSIFLNDYFHRKLVILLPLVLMVIAVAVSRYKEFHEYLAGKGGLETRYKYYLLFSACFSLAIFLLNCSKRRAGFDVITDQMPVLLGAFILQLTGILYVYKSRVYKFAAGAVFVLILVPSMYLDVRYVYLNPTYSYKNAMLSLGKYIDGEIVAGGVANGFRLYNRSLPVLDGYGYKRSEAGRRQYKVLLDRILAEHRAKYTILYNLPGGSLYCAGNAVYDRKLDLILELDLIQTAGGGMERIGLYRYRFP